MPEETRDPVSRESFYEVVWPPGSRRLESATHARRPEALLD